MLAFHARSVRVAFALCCVSWLAMSAGAQANFKLNGPLARSNRAGFWVGEVRVAPGGHRVVYDAALDSEAGGLFSVRIDGSEAPARLVPVGMFYSVFEVSSEWVVVSDDVDLYRVPIDASRAPAPILPPALTRTIHGLRISPDGSRVVYIASTDGGPRELFSVATRGGSAPIRISGTPPSGWVFHLQISPDGGRVVFTSNGESAGVIELYGTPIDGSSSPVKLNGPMQGQGIPFWTSPVVQISSDGARVVYVADQDLRGAYELYSAPLDARWPARKLNGPLVSRGDVWSFVIAPDGRRVVYLADQEADERRELYSAPIDLRSGSAVKLNGPLVPDGDVMYSGYGISPDSRHVSYWAQEASHTLDLRVALIDGGAVALPLSGALFGGSTFSPDGQRILYRSGAYGDVHLHSASIVTGDSVDLTDSSGPYAWLYGHVITKDSSTSVVFLEGPGDGRRLHRVPLLGGSTPVLLGDVPGSSELELAPGSRRVLFRASPTVDWLDEIFSVPVDGTSAPVRLTDPPVTDLVTADVTSVCVNPRGGRSAFVVRIPAGYDGGEDRVALYSAVLEPRSRPIQLFQTKGGIQGCTIDATGERVVFLASPGEANYRPWSARLDGELPPVRLIAPTSTSTAFRLTPDGAQVIFDAHEGGLGSELQAVAIDGGPVTELTDELLDDGEVVAFEVTADGSRAVFVSGRYSREFQLYSVPVDGSTGPVRLNGDLVPGGSVDFAFQVGPDALTVVYRADQERNEVFELFAVPADGSSGPVKVSGTLVGGGDAQPAFRITHDGTVVFSADRTVNQVFELFAAPIAGSAEPVKLSGTLVAGGDVEPDFELAPDGARVVFRADLELDERFDLYAAPRDGSLAPVRLSGPLVAGGDVLDVRVSPDGQRAVYRADATVDEQVGLHSVPVDGSAPPIAVAGPLPPGGDVLERFDLTPDGQRVVYAADADVDNVFELYAAPLDRSKAARKLSGPLVLGGDAAVFQYQNSPAASFSITSDGRAVLYLADQESDDVVELFVSFLERPYRLTADRPR